MTCNWPIEVLAVGDPDRISSPRFSVPASGLSVERSDRLHGAEFVYSGARSFSFYTKLPPG
jgi:hypothetical protein